MNVRTYETDYLSKRNYILKKEKKTWNKMK